MSKKMLVAYFSASGVTAKTAQKLAEAADTSGANAVTSASAQLPGNVA